VSEDPIQSKPVQSVLSFSRLRKIQDSSRRTVDKTSTGKAMCSRSALATKNGNCPVDEDAFVRLVELIPCDASTGPYVANETVTIGDGLIEITIPPISWTAIELTATP